MHVPLDPVSAAVVSLIQSNDFTVDISQDGDTYRGGKHCAPPLLLPPRVGTPHGINVPDSAEHR